MTNYVVGFAFNLDRTRVVMIEKQKPEWQRGKLNGVGGKVEPGERPQAAMAREFHEEAGLLIPAERWELFAILHIYEGVKAWPEHQIAFHRTLLADIEYNAVVTQETEQIARIMVPFIMDQSLPLIRNIRMLVAMALDESGLDLPVFLTETNDD